MKTFDSLTEQEVLALAIALEEEDARIRLRADDHARRAWPHPALSHPEHPHRHRRRRRRGAGGIEHHLLGAAQIHGHPARVRPAASDARRRARLPGRNFNRYLIKTNSCYSNWLHGSMNGSSV